MRSNAPPAERLSWSAEGVAVAAEALRRGGRLRMRVHGESMLPAIWPGDVVGIESCSPSDIRPGDVALALRDGRFFLHRLIASSDAKGFVLGGDSVPAPDVPYPAEALLGRLVSRSGDRWRSSFCTAKLSRAAGLLLAHCGPLRRLALKLRSRRTGSGGEFREFRDPEPVSGPNLANPDALEFGT